jgi:hypothetical protein
MARPSKLQTAYTSPRSYAATPAADSHDPAWMESRTTRESYGSELAKVAHGALEVVSDDLVLLQESWNRFDPVGEALMQLGPDLLRQRLVCGVADQQVPEPVGVVSSDLCVVGTDELLPDQRDQLVGYAVARCRRSQSRDGASVKDLAFDGSSLDHGALGVVQQVEPRLQESTDRRRDHDCAVCLAGEGRHFLQEQRVALGYRKGVPPRLGV